MLQVSDQGLLWGAVQGSGLGGSQVGVQGGGGLAGGEEDEEEEGQQASKELEKKGDV